MIAGRARKVGDNVDTDMIVPGRYTHLSDPQVLAAHCMEGWDPEFPRSVKPGDIVVAGRNFGCGSSREHAPIALKASGISCIIGASFARIFFRNCINIGLPLLECSEAAERIGDGDNLEVNLDTGLIRNLTVGEEYHSRMLPEFVTQICRLGGLVEYARRRLRGD